MAASSENVSTEVQQRVLDLEERLLDSRWRVARSAHLHEASRTLQRQLDGIVTRVTPAEIARHVASATGSEMMSLQRVEENRLKLLATRGFDARFSAFFDSVGDGDCACGTALKSMRQTVVRDIEASPIFVGEAAQEELRVAGVASCVSTPLRAADGSMRGVFSIHRRTVWTPEGCELAQLEDLAAEIVTAMADPFSAEARLIRGHT